MAFLSATPNDLNLMKRARSRSLARLTKNGSDLASLSGTEPNESSSSLSAPDTARRPASSERVQAATFVIEPPSDGTSYKRPAISYASLIAEAIQKSPERRLLLADIYQTIQERYPFFKTAGTGWKNSIRHNLSLNKSFRKIPRSGKGSGKGNYWVLAAPEQQGHPVLPSHESEFRYLQGGSFPSFLNNSADSFSRARSLSMDSSKLPPILPKPTGPDLATLEYGLFTDGPLTFENLINIPGPLQRHDAGYQERLYRKLTPVLPNVSDLFIPNDHNQESPGKVIHDVWVGAGTPISSPDTRNIFSCIG